MRAALARRIVFPAQPWSAACRLETRGRHRTRLRRRRSRPARGSGVVVGTSPGVDDLDVGWREVRAVASDDGHPVDSAVAAMSESRTRRGSGTWSPARRPRRRPAGSVRQTSAKPVFPAKDSTPHRAEHRVARPAGPRSLVRGWWLPTRTRWRPRRRPFMRRRWCQRCTLWPCAVPPPHWCRVEHQLKSAGRARSRGCVVGDSTSVSSAGTPSRSMMLSAWPVNR